METKSSPRISSPRASLEAPADDAVDVVDYLEPLQLLERLHAADAHVDHAELPVVEQHPLHIDLHVRQGGQAGDVVVVHAGVAQDVGDGPQQVLGAEGLGDVGGGAGAVGLHHVRQLGPGSEEHDGDVLGVAELELAAHLVAVHAGHGDVEEDEVGVPGVGELEALLAAGRGEHLVAVGGKDGGDRRRSGRRRRRSPGFGGSRPAFPFPPRAGLRARQLVRRPRTNPIGTVSKRIRHGLPGRVTGQYTCRRAEASRRGDHDEGIRPRRRNALAAHRRRDHVPAAAARHAVRRRRRRGRRPPLRHRPRRAHGRPLRTHGGPRGLTHPPPHVQPGAARGGLRPALGGRRRGRAGGRRRLHRPQPGRHGDHARPGARRRGGAAGRRR